MDKRKASLLGLSILVLVAVLAGTTVLVVKWGNSRTVGCAPSRVADLALQGLKNPEAREKILALDKKFSTEYAQVCMEMCGQRTQLSEQLGTLGQDDPAGTRLLNLINADQALLEKLTWQHILAVRDVLTGPERTAFVQSVKKQWGEAVSHMQHQATMAGTCSLHGPGASGTGER
jgi:hypothetical protein